MDKNADSSQWEDASFGIYPELFHSLGLEGFVNFETVEKFS